jgi:hypothetical protein
MLQVVKEFSQAAEEREERFVIDTDKKAEWALRAIAQTEAGYNRLIDVCQEEIKDYTWKITEYEKKKEADTAYLRTQLQDYFGTVQRRQTKTQDIYELPSGTLRLKHKEPVLEYDEAALVDYLWKTKRSFIKNIRKPQWGEYKKRLKVSGTEVVDTVTGEIVECITATPRDPEFIIQTK